MNRKIKIRKGWGEVNPVTRIHSKDGKQRHKPKYNKAGRKDWKRGVDY